MSTLPAGFTLRLARDTDFPAIRVFYDQLIDDMESLPHHPMWDKNGHPADAYLREAIAGDELWLAEGEMGVVGAMVVNGKANDGYNGIPWQVEAALGEFVIVHAFGVSTRQQGKGLGSAMMRAVIDAARAAGKKAIRLDLIDLNLPTGKVYTRLGFHKCAEVKLYYPEVGWQLFHMFEYAL